MRLHLVVVESTPGETDALVRELRRAGFDPALHQADDAATAARTAQAAAASGPSSARALAVDVVQLGPPATGDRPLDPAVVRDLTAARGAFDRAIDDTTTRASLDQLAVALWQLGADGATAYANPALYALFEIDGAADLAARDARAFFPGDGLARLASTDAGPGCAEVDVAGARGGKRRAIAVESRVIDARGERSIVRAFIEVTELRRLEDQSHQAQKLEAIGRLAGGIAHDFNNLLTVAFTCCGLLHRSIPTGDRAHAHVDQIQSAVKRGSALTHQLLAFARQQRIELTSIDVNDVVTKMASMLRHVIGDDIELRVNVDRALRPVRADRGQLEQVLMNLAINARDAMPRGGKLVVSTVNATLEGDAARRLDAAPGDYVLVAVTDTGVGMDEETRARVFEPFFTTKAGKGTGLGLATAFGIVREGGGAIAVESAPGQGTTFRLWMPVAGEEAQAPRPSLVPPVARLATETVLLVDDEDGIRGSLAEFLRLQGFRVLEARNGLDAMEHARQHQGEIHVLVSDVVMPRMGGKSLADALLALRPSMKVIFLSGYSESTILRRGHLDATVPLLQKPFPPEALVSRIHEIMSPGGQAK